MTWKRVVVTVSAAAVVAGSATLAPSEAQAHGRRGGRAIVVGVGPRLGFGWGYGFDPFYSPFYGPLYGPYYYSSYAHRASGGIDPNVALMAGLGAIDVNVKPGRAEVWVDGKYVAEARNLDGEPSYLWLPEGTHRLSIRKGGYATFEAQIDVRRGITRQLKVHLNEAEAASAPEPTGAL